LHPDSICGKDNVMPALAAGIYVFEVPALGTGVDGRVAPAVTEPAA